MTLLLIAIAVAATWIGVCIVVAGVCVSAARGDRAPAPLKPVPACSGRRRVRAFAGLPARHSITHR